MTIPLKEGDRDYSKATINFAGIEGVDFNGLRIDHIAKVGDHLEAAYTVTSRELAEMMRLPQRVACSSIGEQGHEISTDSRKSQRR